MSSSPATGRRRPYAARVPLEVRREQLLDAAIRVIVRDGYDGVSVDAIAREAGVTRPVVYGAYDGLGPLLEALLDRQQARALDQLARALPDRLTPGGGDPEQQVLGTVRALVDTVVSDPLTWRPILLAPHGTPEPVRERIDADRERVREQLAGLLAAGLAMRGDVEPRVDVEVASHALVAVLEHFGRLLLEEPERFDADRLVELARLLLGAFTRPGQGRSSGPTGSGASIDA
jgi:AcrR family transcriptional regulator